MQGGFEPCDPAQKDIKWPKVHSRGLIAAIGY